VSKVESAQAIFKSYLTQDRDAADRLVSQEMLSVVPTEGDDVFVMYEYELKTGGRHRNVEVLTVRDDRIIETQVSFGGPVR